jgi:C1A family cysteine protease
MSAPRKFMLRRQPEDPRDLVHPACKASAPLPAPTSIDLSAAMPTALDQEDVGTCAANACSNALRFCLAKEGKAQFQPSRLYIYWFTRKLMGVAPSVDSGSDMRAVCEAVRKYHVCDEVAWPYDPKPSVLFTHQPSAAALGAAQPHAGLQYLAVPKTLEAISVALHEGHPIMAGITVFASFEAEAVARTGDVPMPAAGEQALGGHAVLMTGIDVDAKTITFLNSWGAGWGKRGFFKLPFAYVLDPNMCFDLWTFRFFA